MLSINFFFKHCLIPVDFLTSVFYWKKHLHPKGKKKGYRCFQREEGSGIEFVACCSLKFLYCVSGSQRVPLPDQLLWFADHVVPVFQLSAPRIHERPNDHNAQQHCQYRQNIVTEYRYTGNKFFNGAFKITVISETTSECLKNF